VIYGNGRLGLIQEDAQTFVFNNQVTLPNEGPYWTQKTGKKNYELTNYLGNVNAVITDRKVLDPTNPVFKAVVVATTDYYAFGMAMPDRQTGSGSYRFGYNGMEIDKEMSGNGNSYTTEFRQYDPRLGRWKSLDPLMAHFPWQSPYCAFDNNPVYFVDPLGLEGNGPGGLGGNPNATPAEPEKGYTCYDETHDETLSYSGNGEWETKYSKIRFPEINSAFSDVFYAEQRGAKLNNEVNIALKNIDNEIKHLSLVIDKTNEYLEKSKKLVNEENNKKSELTEKKSEIKIPFNSTWFEFLHYLDDYFQATGSGIGLNQYGGDGKLGEIDDEVERKANIWGPHWLSPNESFRTYTFSGDTIFCEYRRFKWHWGEWEQKNFKLTILNGDTILIKCVEEINHNVVPRGTIQSY
jgi:RHS repeat-associated protein